MNQIKKNQIVVYSIVLILVIAGYLNYIDNNQVAEISANTQNTTNIGDARLVNSNETSEEENKEEENKEEGTKTEDYEENLNSEVTNSVVDEDEEYFTNSKIEREKMYSQMLESYQKIIENESVSEEQKAIGLTEITKINNTRNAIMICENLIEIKGFEKAVILANGESVNVIIKAENLNTEEIAQIQNIVTRELGTNIENIHIMKK